MVMLRAEPPVFHSSTVTCIICHTHTPPSHATAGSVGPDNSQAFACTQHLRQRRAWIIAWSAFEAERRRTRGAEGRAR